MTAHDRSPVPAPRLAVCIGRFQVLHAGHLGAVRHALTLAPRCVVVLGSAHQARSPRNPFTWQERAALLQLALPEADRARVDILPVRDYYDEAAWVRAVRRGVAALHPALRAEEGPAPIVLVGHQKDATGAYLDHFSGWSRDDTGLWPDLHGTALRDAYFDAQGRGAPALEAALAAMTGQVPQATLDFLRSWSLLPAYAAVAEEWAALRAEKARWAGAPYAPTFVTVDTVVQCAGRILLIRRARAPGRGLWAVPGGFLEPRETIYQSALRELQEETGLRLLPSEMAAALRAVRVFDHPDRSQRGRVVTHAHYFDLRDRMRPEVEAADDAEAARWFPIGELAAMEDSFHEDHFHMLDAFLGLTGEAVAAHP